MLQRLGCQAGKGAHRQQGVLPAEGRACDARLRRTAMLQVAKEKSDMASMFSRSANGRVGELAASNMAGALMGEPRREGLRQRSGRPQGTAAAPGTEPGFYDVCELLQRRSDRRGWNSAP